VLRGCVVVFASSDPPRFAIYALPLLIGAAVAVTAIANIKPLRDVPLALVAFFLVACSGALAARGGAYAGRVSVHLLCAGCALPVCAIASLAGTRQFSHPGDRESSQPSDPARE